MRAEVDAMQGLPIMPADAARRLGIAEEIIGRVLVELAAEGYTARDEDGGYVRFTGAAAGHAPRSIEPGPLLSGTSDDLRRVEQLFQQLRPGCPRCRQSDPVPLAWATDGIWYQCLTCYKVWRQRLLDRLGSPAGRRASDL